MTDLDAAATELTAARPELREALLLAEGWARHRAHGDPVAAHISQRIDAAFARGDAPGVRGPLARLRSDRDRPDLTP